MQQQTQAQAIVRNYNELIRQAMTGKGRQRERRAEDQQPTLQITASDGWRLTLQNIQDEPGKLPIWRADGLQPNWTIRMKQDREANPKERFPAQLIFTDSQGMTQAERLGYVSVESAAYNHLAQKLQQPGQKLSLSAPIVTMQVPWAQQNDTDLLFEEASRYIEAALAPPAGKEPFAHRQDMAVALWQRYKEQAADGRHIVMKQFPDVLRDRLNQVPQITVGRLQISGEAIQRLIDKSPHTIQFGKDTFPSKTGDVIVPSVSVLKPDGNRFLIGGVAARNVALPTGATYMAAFTQNAGSDRVVNMQVMDLPTIEQTKAEIAAFAEGRSHLTFEYEPYAAYGVREGDIVIAQATAGDKPVALRVKGQHCLDPPLLARAGAVERWSEAEKQPAAALFEQLAAARSGGQVLWGLNVEALGTYERGRITPFEQTVVVPLPQIPSQLAVVNEEAIAPLPAPLTPSRQLWERYSLPQSGVLAAMAKHNPRLREMQDSLIVKQAICEGYSVQAVEQAIAEHSSHAQSSSDARAYAKALVAKADSSLEEIPKQRQAQSKTRPQVPKRVKARDNDMGM